MVTQVSDITMDNQQEVTYVRYARIWWLFTGHTFLGGRELALLDELIRDGRACIERYKGDLLLQIAQCCENSYDKWLEKYPAL